MDNEMIVLKWLFPVFLAALAVVHLISCWRGDDDLRKPTKVALMPVVALTYLAFANTPSLWVVAGLLFGCLGDLFLLRPLQKHFFALGTASFFLASDGVLCDMLFIKKAEPTKQNFAVMGTYILAQVLLTMGFAF